MIGSNVDWGKPVLLFKVNLSCILDASITAIRVKDDVLLDKLYDFFFSQMFWEHFLELKWWYWESKFMN